MRKLSITNCEIEHDRMRLVTIVLLSGVVVFDGVSVNVNTRSETNTMGLSAAEVAEWGVQQCVRNLMKAVEPTEVEYANNTSEYISHWLSGPATTKTFVPGTIPFGEGTVSPRYGVHFSSGEGISASTTSGTSSFVLNNAAQTASTT
jgi:hypothetical protein